MLIISSVQCGVSNSAYCAKCIVEGGHLIMRKDTLEY
jgi:hypothetical protein